MLRVCKNSHIRLGRRWNGRAHRHDYGIDPSRGIRIVSVLIIWVHYGDNDFRPRDRFEMIWQRKMACICTTEQDVVYELYRILNF